MSNVYRYVPGMLRIDSDGTVSLPHSCDAWEIGGETAVRALIADLQAALDGSYVEGDDYEEAYKE